MMMDKLFLLLGLLSVHPTVGEFTLDLVPVSFPGTRSEGKVYLKVKDEQEHFTPGEEVKTCSASTGPFGNGGTLSTDGEDTWKIRVSIPDGYYLKFDAAPTKININIRFGATTCTDCEFNGVDLIEWPLTDPVSKYTLTPDPDAVEISGAEGLISVDLDLDAETNCNIMDNDGHDFIFSVKGKLYQGDYEFKPCLTYMTWEDDDDSLDTVEYKDSASREKEREEQRLSEGGTRLLEEDTCIYCDWGKECACCPDTTTNPQESSSIAVAGVTPGAIATVLGIFATLVGLVEWV